MGLLHGILGNATRIDPASLEDIGAKLLLPGERMEQAYRLIRDLLIFTDKRLILVNVQGVTGKKTDYHSIPYRSISHYSIETAGHFDLDATLCVYLTGDQEPLVLDFAAGVDCFELQRLLAGPVLE